MGADTFGMDSRMLGSPAARIVASASSKEDDALHPTNETA